MPRYEIKCRAPRSAEQSFGPLREHIVSFRGLKVPAIENLGATNDHFDTIDLCDNDLIRVDNFPPLKRLSCLLLANNRIKKIDPDIFSNLPSIVSLVLTNNKFVALEDLTPFSRAKCLERLSLVDNPVTSLPRYRSYVIHSIPTLRFLDFQHVKEKERNEANAFFSTSQGIALLKGLQASSGDAASHTKKSNLDRPMETPMKDYSTEAKLTVPPPPSEPSLQEFEIHALQDAMASATSLSDVQMLEQTLRTGVIPPDVRLRLNI